MIFPSCGSSCYFHTFFITGEENGETKTGIIKNKKTDNKSDLFTLQYLAFKKTSVHVFYNRIFLNQSTKRDISDKDTKSGQQL